MKVLISNAVWGEAYCSIFTRFSLATLLSHRNIPKLAEHATITFHIVTARRYRERLSRHPAIVELKRYCDIEWEVIEDFGIYRPPEGPGGEKYPFLSALQNLAITRTVDHDVVVFNYADFVWADGSLAQVVDMLLGGREPLDAVFSFCLPVDRDSAVITLERHRHLAKPEIIELAPREGAKIAIECMHRDAKVRFWDHPRFTVTPSYLMWRVNDAGVLIRAYHQSILALRVRRNDPQYRRGIVRGSLDSSFGAAVAESSSLGFATDTDKVLVFSLYDTPVDSRMPAGMTREMSLQRLLAGDVTPEQRVFAERPFFLRLRDGDEALWREAAEKSWRVLRQAQDATCFDRSAYDKNLLTHGVVPRFSRQNVLKRHAIPYLMAFIHRTGLGSEFEKFAATANEAMHRILRVGIVLRHPPLLRAAIARRLNQLSPWRRARRIWQVLRHPPLLRAAIKRRLMCMLRGCIAVGPGMWVPLSAHRRFVEAISVEDTASRVVDNVRFGSALRTAEQSLRDVLKVAPTWVAPVRALGRNLWFQGRFDEAIETFAAAEQMRDDMAGKAGLPVDSCVFLPRDCATSIGLMGHLDAFVKYKILTGDPRRFYLLAPSPDIVNNAFLDYWKDYVSIISQPGEIESLEALEAVYGVNWNWVVPNKDGRMVFIHEGIAAIQRTWESTGRPPLLTLRRDHADALSDARAKWGMKEDDRFVCLHVRSIGFYGESREQAQRFRNTSIESYYPLIRTLADMGLWVIRMGDASMPPLDLAQCGASGRVVDYALSPEKSAELDVSLCAQCELFVSSPSGLHTVAHAFGRPVCEVNYPIYRGFPWHPGDIFIPQLYFSHEKGRVLTLDEILGSDILHRDHQFLLERAGISLLPNELDDIVETVREALSPSTYRVKDAAAADRVCTVFDEFNRKHDLGISGRLGRYFAMKYAPQLLPAETPAHGQIRASPLPKGRKLDILIPVFNRPQYLHRILESGLALAIPGMYFVVFDDASNAFEDVPGLGLVTVEMVCRSFDDERVIYTRNPTNMGVAKTLKRYYCDLCDAEYTSLLNPKDQFICAGPIARALAKLDDDPKLSFVVYPLRQIDRMENDRPLLFDYDRMSGSEFVAAHVRDSMLQHCSGYAILRVAALRRSGIPRDLDLRAYGLEDASGIDHEMLFTLATTGDVAFESEAPVRRTIIGGYTEQYPLTFAYSQYQYARRLMAELEPRGFVSAGTRRLYLGFWHLIIARGLVVAYRHVHGSEQEQGVTRIRPHLPMPILFYIPAECLRFRVMPRAETVKFYLVGARLLLTDWWNKVHGRPYVC